MINFDNFTNQNKTEHNPKWPYIPDYPYRILIIGDSGSGKTAVLQNLLDIGKIYLYTKGPYKAIYQTWKGRFTALWWSQTFTEYSNDMQDVFKNSEEYNLEPKRKVLIVFDDMIAHIISNKKLNPIVTELFIRGRKLNISIILYYATKF